MKTKLIALIVLGCYLYTCIIGPCPVNADAFRLPTPGAMIALSPAYNPPILKGLKVDPNNPFKFEFILDQGDIVGARHAVPLRQDAIRLIKYFLASITIPEQDLWVNLSPYEKNRIIPQSFGLTEMGRDLLAEDYMLKQITASLIYPEGETGKKFWQHVYQEAAKRYGTTNVPVNTFNKVWIVPEKAVVYENAQAGTAYVVESKLKVMLEEDYLSMQKHQKLSTLGSEILRQIVIPELNKEVNEGKNFAQLRQVYNSVILATWYKKKIKDSLLAQVYTNQNKIKGIEYNQSIINGSRSNDVELIYQQYLKAFKKGVFNYIKEVSDPSTQNTIPRKYFSGGTSFAQLNTEMSETEQVDSTQLNPSVGLFTVAGRFDAAMARNYHKLGHGHTSKQWIENSRQQRVLQNTVILQYELAISQASSVDEIENLLKEVQESSLNPRQKDALENLAQARLRSIPDQAMARSALAGHLVNAKTVHDINEVFIDIKLSIDDLRGFVIGIRRSREELARVDANLNTIRNELRLIKNGIGTAHFVGVANPEKVLNDWEKEIDELFGRLYRLQEFTSNLLNPRPVLNDKNQVNANHAMLIDEIDKRGMINNNDDAENFARALEDQIKIHIYADPANQAMSSKETNPLDTNSAGDFLNAFKIHSVFYDSDIVPVTIPYKKIFEDRRLKLSPSDQTLLKRIQGHIFINRKQKFQFWYDFKGSKFIRAVKPSDIFFARGIDDAENIIPGRKFMGKIVIGPTNGKDYVGADEHVHMGVLEISGSRIVRNMFAAFLRCLPALTELTINLDESEYFSEYLSPDFRSSDLNKKLEQNPLVKVTEESGFSRLKTEFYKEGSDKLIVKYTCIKNPPIATDKVKDFNQAMYVHINSDFGKQMFFDIVKKELQIKEHKAELIGQGGRNFIFNSYNHVAFRIYHHQGEISPDAREGFEAAYLLGRGPRIIAEGFTRNHYYFLAVEQIEGKSLDNFSYLNAKQWEDFKQMWNEIIDKKYFMDDPKPQQFMYGTTKRVVQQRWWIADAEMFKHQSNWTRNELIDAYIKKFNEHAVLYSEDWKNMYIKDRLINFLRGLKVDEVKSKTQTDHLSKEEKAMVAQKTGGIDLTADQMPLEIQNFGTAIKYHLDPAMIKQLQNASGFVPIIVNIQPLRNLSAFLGIKPAVGVDKSA